MGTLPQPHYNPDPPHDCEFQIPPTFHDLKKFSVEMFDWAGNRARRAIELEVVRP